MILTHKIGKHLYAIKFVEHIMEVTTVVIATESDKNRYDIISIEYIISFI